MNSREKPQTPFAFYRRRTNDYKKDNSMSLLKDVSLFRKSQGPQYGGSSEGAYLKNDKSLYYLADHNLCEYFAYEIMQRLGVHTPKARLIVTERNKSKITTQESILHNKRFIIASKSVHDYIPIRAVRPDVPVSSLPAELVSFSNQHQLDFDRQLITDSIEGREYKISGNLFIYDIIALLISDTDLQPKGNNLGLVKIANRFYAVAIDKDAATFKGNNYYQLRGCLGEDVLEDSLFKYRTLDQVLAIINEIYHALKPDSKGVCDFDRIFHNERVLTTPYLSEQAPIYCENIKKSARSIVEYYQSELGRICFDDFQQREWLRANLADQIIHHLGLSESEIDLSELKKIIVEDLRGPYYQNHFKSTVISLDDLENNPELFNAVILELKQEFDLIPHSVKLEPSCDNDNTDNEMANSFI